MIDFKEIESKSKLLENLMKDRFQGKFYAVKITYWNDDNFEIYVFHSNIKDDLRDSFIYRSSNPLIVDYANTNLHRTKTYKSEVLKIEELKHGCSTSINTN